MLETLAAGLFPKEGPLASWSCQDRVQSLLLQPAGRCNMDLGIPFGRPARLIMSELLERVHNAAGRHLCLDGDFFAALISVMQSYYSAGRFANWSLLACEEVVRFFDTAYAVRQNLGHSTLQSAGEFATAYRWRYASEAARAAGEAEAFEVELSAAFHRSLRAYQRATKAPVVRQLLCNPGDAILAHDLYVLLADTQAAGEGQHMPLHVLQQALCAGSYRGLAPEEFHGLVADAVARIGALDPQVVEAVNLSSFLLTIAAVARPTSPSVPAPAPAPAPAAPLEVAASPAPAAVASGPAEELEAAPVSSAAAVVAQEAEALAAEVAEMAVADAVDAVDAVDAAMGEMGEMDEAAGERAEEAWGMGETYAPAAQAGDWAFGPSVASPVAEESWSMGDASTVVAEEPIVELEEEFEIEELSAPAADLASAHPLFPQMPTSEALERHEAQRRQMREQPSFCDRLERSWPRAVELVSALARYGAKNILQPGAAIDALNAVMVYAGDFLDRLDVPTPGHLQPLMLQLDLMMEEGILRSRTYPLSSTRLVGRLPEAELLYRNLVPAEATRRAEGAFALGKQAMSRVFGSLDPHPNIPQMDQIHASALAAGVLLGRFAGSNEEAERLRHILFLELRAALGAATAGLAPVCAGAGSAGQHDVWGASR